MPQVQEMTAKATIRDGWTKNGHVEFSYTARISGIRFTSQKLTAPVTKTTGNSVVAESAHDQKIAIMERVKSEGLATRVEITTIETITF
jgi:hypothetical protein